MFISGQNLGEWGAAAKFSRATCLSKMWTHSCAHSPDSNAHLCDSSLPLRTSWRDWIYKLKVCLNLVAFACELRKPVLLLRPELISVKILKMKELNFMNSEDSCSS